MDLLTLHIIHNSDDVKRMNLLSLELIEQGISNWFLWPSVHDSRGSFYGINKAHKQIVEWARDNNLPFVTIAEDDIRFFDQGAYDYFLSKEPKEYDIYLGGVFLGKVNNNEVSNFTGLTLYRVDRRYYDKFLSADSDSHLDVALWQVGGKFIVCDPFVVKQHNGFSNNENRHMNYDFMFEHRNVFKKL